MGTFPTIEILDDDESQPTNDELAFFEVLKVCYDKFVARNRQRHGIWRRSGIRGMTHEVFAKAERAYVQVHVENEIPDPDHYQDVVNYAIFTLILLQQHQFNIDELMEGKVGIVDRKTLDEIEKINQRFLYGEWPR